VSSTFQIIILCVMLRLQKIWLGNIEEEMSCVRNVHNFCSLLCNFLHDFIPGIVTYFEMFDTVLGCYSLLLM
jgi:hypothetical protein